MTPPVGMSGPAPSRPRRRAAAVVVGGLGRGLALGLALTACSSSGGGGGNGAGTAAIAVTSTSTTCDVARNQLTAGKATFRVDNRGDKELEVYVYAKGDRIVAEREDIGPGTTASFSADLKAGAYEIACKPGQSGKGIRHTITVS